MDIRYASPCLIPCENPYILTNKQDLFSRCKVSDIIKSFVILNTAIVAQRDSFLIDTI